MISATPPARECKLAFHITRRARVGGTWLGAHRTCERETADSQQDSSVIDRGASG